MSHQQSGVPPLKTMVTNLLIKNIKSINDIGGIDYEFCRPFLRAIQNPEQLNTIEEACPQIKGKDKEIWLAIIKRKCGDPAIDSLPEPEDDDWYGLYKELQEEYDETKKQQVSDLAKAFSSLTEDKSKKRAILINNLPPSFKRPKMTSSGWGRASTKTQTNALQKARRETQTYSKNMSVAERYQAGNIRRTLNGRNPTASVASTVERVASRRAEERLAHSGRTTVADAKVLQKRPMLPTASPSKKLGGRR